MSIGHKFWGPRRGSNPRPPRWQRGALNGGSAHQVYALQAYRQVGSLHLT